MNILIIFFLLTTFNLDEAHFIYKGQKLTFSGVVNKVIQEKKDKLIQELMKIIPKWKSNAID